MAKRNTLRLDTSAFNDLLEELDRKGVDIKPLVSDALEQAGETIEWDTRDAMAKPNLPRGGKYSTGKTEKTIIKNPKVVWKGMTAEIAVGFDFGMDGAGGYLISGTPRMKPNYKLEDIYARKKYMKQIQSDISDVLMGGLI